MAETIAAAVAAIGSAASSAGAAIGSAYAYIGGASTLSAIGTVASVAGTVASLAGAGMRVASAQSNLIGAKQQADSFSYQAQQELARQQQALIQARQAGLQAEQANLQGDAAELAGRTEAARTRLALLRTLGAQNARYAGAGLALDEGTPATLEEDARAQAEIELGIIDTNTRIAAADKRISAAGFEAGAADRTMAAAAFGLNSLEYDRRARDTLRTAQNAYGASIFDAADRVWQRLPGWSSSSSFSGSGLKYDNLKDAI